MYTNIILDDYEVASKFIAAGEVVAIPTETVYGLAANALDPIAVKRLYELKGRPENKPISLLVDGMKMVNRFCRSIPLDAYDLAAHFWPGPLTMVFECTDEVPEVVTAGTGTVGVRCPMHPSAHSIIKATGVPLATPSANMSGEPAPIKAIDVLNTFDGRIACLVDGGTCDVGIASTVLDMTSTPYKILREGTVTREKLEKVLGKSAVV